jgi:hypothetical protein
VAHFSHEDRLDDNRRTPPRVPPIRQGINMDRQQDRRYYIGMYKSLSTPSRLAGKYSTQSLGDMPALPDGQTNKRKINFCGVWRTRMGSTSVIIGT